MPCWSCTCRNTSKSSASASAHKYRPTPQCSVSSDLTAICLVKLLAVALGGRVGRNPGGFIAKGRVSGVALSCLRDGVCAAEEIEVLPTFAKLLRKDVKSFAMIKVHGEQVLDLPEQAVRLATSKSSVNEIWCFRSAIAIQGHPEFASDLVIRTILPSLKQRR